MPAFDLATSLATECATAHLPLGESLSAKDVARHQQLFVMAEACLSTVGERLSNQAEREFKPFDLLSTSAASDSSAQTGLSPPPFLSSTDTSFSERVQRAGARLGRDVFASRARLEQRWADARAAEASQWRQEHRVLSLYCHLLHASGFVVCDQVQAERQLSLHSSCGVHVRVNWSALDQEMLTRFDPYARPSPFHSVDRPLTFGSKVLVAYRGTSIRLRDGFFFAEKTDEVIRRAAARLWRPLCSSTRSDDEDRAIEGMLDSGGSPLPGGSGGGAGGGVTQGIEERMSTVSEIRSLGLRAYFAWTRLVEPCFGTVLLLYRSKYSDTEEEAALNVRNIFIRSYRRVSTYFKCTSATEIIPQFVVGQVEPVEPVECALI